MPKRLQPTVSITGLLAIQVKSARLKVLRSLPEGTEQEVFIGKQLGAAEAVMHLKMRNLIARILDSRLLVSRPGGFDCFREVRLNLVATADKGIIIGLEVGLPSPIGYGQPLNQDIIVPQLFGNLGRGNNAGG